MIIETVTGVPISAKLIDNYFQNLVGMFFKILPMKEDGVETLPEYLNSFRAELIGCRELISAIHDDPMFLSLILNLQVLIDNPDYTPRKVRQIVFNSITICNKLRASHTEAK